MPNQYINVQLTKVPGARVQFTLDAGSDIGTLLETADMSADGYQIRSNGAEVSPDTVLEDGAEVILVKMIKGNA